MLVALQTSFLSYNNISWDTPIIFCAGLLQSILRFGELIGDIDLAEVF